jgi:phage recombination protein Bet
MSTAVAIRPTPGIPALALQEAELLGVLRSSLYVGAADESIKLVVGYCRAAGLDPMQKPVHIVPMWDSKAGTMRDVVMPGVGLYRTQAARSGQLAGITEPEFGPDKTQAIGGFEITFPEWCRVTVRRRLPTGEIVEFTAKERWIENYAVKGGKEKSIAPNAMWSKRPYAQLAKCAQAQALRTAFPEMTGAAPTADEMEGKAIDVEAVEVTTHASRHTPPPPDTAALEDLRDAAMEGSAALEAAWKALTKEQRKSLAGELGALKEHAAAADNNTTNTED